jgi:hypothetical protein
MILLDDLDVRQLEHGMVVQTCNPSYLGGEDWEDHDLRPSQAKTSEIPSQQKSQVWWCTLVIPATQEM